MNELFEQLQSNQFLSGGIVTVLFSAILYQGRALGNSFLIYIKRKVCSTIHTESNYSEDYEKLDYWISTNFVKKANSYILSNPPKIAQCSIYQIKNWCILNIRKDVLEKENLQYAVYRYTISIYGLRSFRENILDKISKVKIPFDKGCPLRHNYYLYGNVIHVQKPITDKMINIVKDYENFLSKEKEYHKFGVTYHRNYLLYGKPGTGKTSLIKYIARKNNQSVQSISITPDTQDENLLDHFGDKTETIFVLEDLDRVDFECERLWSNQVLFNILDGMYTNEGSIIFATVNNKDKLDPALIRSGRFDVIEEIHNPSNRELERYLQENNLPVTLEEVQGKTIADIQKIIKSKL